MSRLEDFLDSDEIEQMSDEEKEAFLSEIEGEEDETESKTEEEAKEEEGEEEGEGEVEEGEDQGEPEEEVEPEEKDDKPDEPAQPEPKVEDEPESEPDEVDGSSAQIEEHKKELQKLREQLEEGEITFEDYHEQWDGIKDKIRDIEIAKKLRETIAAEKEKAQKEEFQRRWEEDQKAFYAANTDISEDKAVFKTFARQVNSKLNDPEYQSISNNDILEEAAMETRAIKGLSKPGSKEEKDVAKARQGASKSKKVKTLADAPASASEDVGDSKFAYLDKLIDSGDVQAMESALAKLTPEQQEKYLRS